MSLSSVQLPGSLPVAEPVGITNLPEELLLEVLGYLPPHVLAGRVSLVSKDLRKVALDPCLYKSYVHIFGKAEYENYADVESLGLNFDGLSPIDRKTAVALALPFFGRLDKEGLMIEGDEGVTILDIPANLSFNKLKAFAEKPKSDQPAFLDLLVGLRFDRFDPISGSPFPYILRESGDTAIPKAYRIMISRNVLQARQGINKGVDPSVHVETLKCRMPTTLEITALALTTFVSSALESPVRLYSDRTHTLCSDLVYSQKVEIGYFKGSQLSGGYYSAYENASGGYEAAVVRVISSSTQS